MSNTAHIAVPAGVNESGQRLFARGSRLLTEDELLAAVEDDYEKAAEEAELGQELGLVNQRVRSYDPKTLTSCGRSRPSTTMLILSMGSRPSQPSSTCARSRS